MKSLEPKRGVSLIEILLVLTLIVVLAALALPNVRSAFASQRLKKGAEAVRAEWARARNRAIKTGQVQIFRHLVSGDGFITTTQISPEDFIEGDERYIYQDIESTGSVQVGRFGQVEPLEHLPEEVYFLGADVALDQRSSAQMLNYQQEVSTVQDFSNRDGTTTASEWGMPIFFFPDGSASSARLVLANAKGLAISVELRGLTGVARVSSLQMAANIAPVGGAIQ